MDIEKKIESLVISHLKISPTQYSEELAVGDIPEWDSLAHVMLLQKIESEFNFTFDVSDAIDIETIEDLIEKIKEYLAINLNQ